MNSKIAPDTIKGTHFFWQLKIPNQRLADELEKALTIPPLLALILTTRNINSQGQAKDFLYSSLKDMHSPYQLPDIDKAVSRIAHALAEGEQIAIYGDYDVDGITGTAILVHFLSSFGGRVGWHIPHRVKEGYGLNTGALTKLHSRGVTLVVTVDCGSTDHEPIQLAREHGMDIIITDHHKLPDTPPEANVILNPKGHGKIPELADLAGVGVAFYLATAIRAYFRREGRWSGSEQPNLKKYLDLVALGTLADMAPLTGTNRILASNGLSELSRTSRPGLLALKETCGLRGGKISNWDVLFRLGPRLNAPGRLGSSDPALRLLLTTDCAEAQLLAQQLEELNRQRQSVEDQLLAEALSLIEANKDYEQSSSLVLASPGWHKGVLGLVASRLTERFNKPTILLTLVDEHWEGSGRSVGNFDLYQALARCSKHLVRFGGHRLAAGLGLTQSQLTEFFPAFEEAVKEGITSKDITKTRKVDAVVHLEEITPELMTYLERMQPYGVGNPEPIFCCRDFQVEDSRVLKGSHLRLRLRQDKARFTGIGFNLLESDQLLPSPQWLLFSPRWNHWRGERQIQLHIIDYK
ncbi:MAG: single-stranded-DNA-specific exonuclease RecJ [Deltaproteobacteria bacterium]|nr:single-stranded-DNA-specific exonuclease RecJ [Deltaproteobacteria bacterium]